MENIINVLPKGTELHNGKRKYKVEQVLGTGGFGITYKVSSTVMVDNVAINTFFAMKEYFLSSCYRDKDNATMLFSPTMKMEVEQNLNDFITEAKRLNSLGHKSDNIVKVNEVFKENGTAYYIMEYLEGGNLREYIGRNGVMNEAEAISIITPICHAVRILHNERILHLDIKPDNIVLKKDLNTGETTPVLIDFGLVKHFDSKGQPTTRLTAKGASDGFAPMEQYTTIDAFSPTLDVYALGATMYYLLVGKNPPKAFDIETSNMLKATLPSSISEGTKNAIVQAMEKSKYDRTPNVGVLLSKFSNNTDIKPKAPVVNTKQFNNKHQFSYKKWGVGIVVAMVVCCIMLLGIYNLSDYDKNAIVEIGNNDSTISNIIVPDVALESNNIEEKGKASNNTVNLSVNCPSKGAKIYINNKFMGEAPLKCEVSPGKYVIEARLKGYVGQGDTILLEEGKDTVINFNALDALTSQLYVNYKPSEAEVWIDGKKAGHTGETFKNITLGNHSIEIRSDKTSYKHIDGNLYMEESYIPEKKIVNISDVKLTTISGNLKIVQKVIEKPVVPTITEPVATVEPIRRDIFFNKREWDINSTGKNRLKELVNYMVKYPDSKVIVTGYDSKKDDNTDNMTISNKRTDAVVQILKNSGIKENRIHSDYKGDRVQPYSDPEMNRVVICIAE